MTDAALLEAGYARARQLTWAYGTTYYWGAALLPRERRRHVYAVYALCRLADDIVDDQATIDRGDLAGTRRRLQEFADAFRVALDSGQSTDPVLAAVAHTAR